MHPNRTQIPRYEFFRGQSSQMLKAKEQFSNNSLIWNLRCGSDLRENVWDIRERVGPHFRIPRQITKLPLFLICQHVVTEELRKIERWFFNDTAGSRTKQKVYINIVQVLRSTFYIAHKRMYFQINVFHQRNIFTA